MLCTTVIAIFKMFHHLKNVSNLEITSFLFSSVAGNFQAGNWPVVDNLPWAHRKIIILCVWLLSAYYFQVSPTSSCISIFLVLAHTHFIYRSHVFMHLSIGLYSSFQLLPIVNSATTNAIAHVGICLSPYF